MESNNVGFTLLRCLGAMAVWLLLAMVAGGVFTVIFGMDAGALTIAPFLGLCGLTIHLCLWTIEREPHWKSAGPVFGLILSVILWISLHADGTEPVVVLTIFLVLSAVSYLVYPVARYILNGLELK